MNPEELYVFENSFMLKACRQLCNREPVADCPDWCTVKIVDSNFSFHMGMKWFNIAEDYALMLQKEDVLKTAKRRLKCKHEWQELQGAMKCPNCGAIFLTKPSPDGAIFLGKAKGEKRK